MRIVFAGTPAAAVPSLRALAGSEHDVALVVTRPDAPIGRKRVLTPSPVAAAAEELGIPVLKTARLDAAATDRIRAAAPELGVIVAYGGLVREPLLSGPAFGWINLHFSLLPNRRGAAPVQRALIAGEKLGWAVFQLVAELDAGDVYEQRAVDVEPEATADAALGVLAEAGAEALPAIVTAIGHGASAEPQVGEPTFAAKLTRADGLLDVHRAADEVHAHYRGVTSEPGAYVLIAGEAVKLPELRRISDAPEVPAGVFGHASGRVLLGTGTEPLEVVRIQPAGKPAMAADAWWRGLQGRTVEVDR